MLPVDLTITASLALSDPSTVAVISGAADIVVQLGAALAPPEVNTCPLDP